MSTAAAGTHQQPHGGTKEFAKFSTAQSRALVEEFRKSVAASGHMRQKLSMSTAASSRKKMSNVSSVVLGQYEAAMKRKSYDEAISFLLEAIRLGEGRHDVLFNVAALLQHRGSYQEAVEFFSKAIADDPMHAEDYLRRSECYSSLNEPLQAYRELEKYFKLEPPTKGLLVKCGKFALDADLLEAAETYLLDALRCDPGADEEANANDAYACFNLGELYERRQMDEKALQYFAKVTQLDPGFAKPYLAQATTEFNERKYPMALHLFEAVAKITPNDPEVYLRLADVYEVLGEEFASSVLSSLTRAIELQQPGENYEKTLVRRGILQYTSFEDLENAIADFSLCLDHNGENSDARLHRAHCLLQRDASGDYLMAIEDYRAAVVLPVPWSVKAAPLAALARHEHEEGNCSLAAQYFSLSALWLPPDESNRLIATVCYAKSIVQHSTVATVTADEGYEPRQYVVVKDEKARKAMEAALQSRGPPVLPLAYQQVDAAYVHLREREPTIHSKVECEFIEAWRPFRDDVERIRDDDVSKNKKGKKK